jgi:hypothetical protein
MAQISADFNAEKQQIRKGPKTSAMISGNFILRNQRAKIVFLLAASCQFLS